MYFCAKVSYDGSKFYGFQRLNELQSVQKVLEDALTLINKKEVLIKGAGRTDKGVHAICQVISFSLDITIDAKHLEKAINSLVAPYILIYDVKEVDASFHARFDVLKKQYTYKINLGKYNPIEADYVYQSPYVLDIEKMKETAQLFLGVHDFHNFVSGEREDYTCIVYDIVFEKEGDILNIHFYGKSFYRYMVRNLVGAMIEVGRGKVDISYIEELLLSKEEKSCYTAPAVGLYLVNIEYS